MRASAKTDGSIDVNVPLAADHSTLTGNLAGMAGERWDSGEPDDHGLVSHNPELILADGPGSVRDQVKALSDRNGITKLPRPVLGLLLSHEGPDNQASH